MTNVGRAEGFEVVEDFMKYMNFELTMGEIDGLVTFNYKVKKTLVNKIKYWLFCKFFPFRITKWSN